MLLVSVLGSRKDERADPASHITTAISAWWAAMDLSFTPQNTIPPPHRALM